MVDSFWMFLDTGSDITLVPTRSQPGYDVATVSEMSMANWCDEMEHLGLDLGDGGDHCWTMLDLKFANDIFLFGTDHNFVGFCWHSPRHTC